ncbi:TPA: hypothetical protein L1209_004236, partial [Escherichia coli]|nr:hypothetical protein [Escherichia coli]MBZ8630172.1 hypothetical protein [Escherichia coli]MBZ8630439.1 hypothetical protein [Escherichia coli]MBZ8630894.1 hypothetical protein [Escherichia coli]MBZ8631373.1 hypothetical protein [Escherichia coli]
MASVNIHCPRCQ